VFGGDDKGNIFSFKVLARSRMVFLVKDNGLTKNQKLPIIKNDKEGLHMENNKTSEGIRKQYGTDSNLGCRIRVKRLFSTGKQSWADFLLQNLCLESNYRILELGCGNAIFWKARSDKIPPNTKLTLSDFSPGMVDAAKGNTGELSFVDEFAVIDAQNIPYNDDTFDIVIANYMLYHVSDIRKALCEISRVLKPSGFFFAATFGKDNLKEVSDIFSGFDSRINHVPEDLAKVFGLENGGSLLEEYFDSVALKRFENSLHITDLDSLVDYFLSYLGMGNVDEIISNDRVPQFSGYIEEAFGKNGYVDITQDEGLFISSVPRK